MKLVYKFYCFFLVATAISCSSNDNDTAVVKASFSYLPREVFTGTTLNFINDSEGITKNTAYLWDFGDGTSSTVKNPSHTYLELGNYNVTLSLKEGDQKDTDQEELRVSLTNDVDGKISLKEKLWDNEILVCAHRGLHKTAPENSIAAIKEAIEEDLDMIEVDVRETRDGELVLLHDETIDRTTNGIGNISSYTLEELQVYRLYDSENTLTNEKIPSLKEVLAISRGKIYINLDVSKKVSFEKVYPIVEQYGMLKQVLFYSSRLDEIKEMISKDSDVIAMPIIDGDERFSDYENFNNIKVVHYTDDSFNQRLVDKAKAKGWYIFMNAYVNTNAFPESDNYSQVDRVRTLSGNIIQTDYPSLVNSYLKN